ncbi:MAG: RNA polymerase sporulation sigma factor SigK [Clostridia bacterium]
MNKILTYIKLFFNMESISDKLAAFLCGNEALPKPMTPEEENMYMRLKEQGSIEAKNILIERNLRLVVYLAKKFDNSGIEADDLISVGTIGLIKAVNSFESNKNIKLATYASRCIENEILMFLRKCVKRRLEVSLDEPLNVDGDGNELVLSDILGTESDCVYKGLEATADMQVLYECMAKLNNRERRIVDMRFGLSGNDVYTQKEVADLLGISQSYISRLEKKIFARLKKDMQKKLI